MLGLILIIIPRENYYSGRVTDRFSGIQLFDDRSAEKCFGLGVFQYFWQYHGWKDNRDHGRVKRIIRHHPRTDAPAPGTARHERQTIKPPGGICAQVRRFI